MFLYKQWFLQNLDKNSRNILLVKKLKYAQYSHYRLKNELSCTKRGAEYRDVVRFSNSGGQAVI